MERLLLEIGTQYPSAARATEAIWKAAYIMGFEIEKETEDFLVFEKKGFLGLGKSRMSITLGAERFLIEANEGDISTLCRKLGLRD